MTVSKELEAEIHRLSAVELWPPGTIARQLVIHIDVVRRVLGLHASPQHVRKGSFAARTARSSSKESSSS
jgi:hypothetical protein